MNKKWQYMYFKRVKKVKDDKYLYVLMDIECSVEESVLLSDSLSKKSTKVSSEFGIIATEMFGGKREHRGTDKVAFKANELSSFIHKKATLMKNRDATWDMGTTCNVFTRRRHGKK